MRKIKAETSSSTPLIAGLSLAQLVGWGSVFYAFSMLLSPVEAALGATRAEVSLALSLALLAEGLAAYPVGRWIDAGHERRVMAGGSLLAGLGLVGLSLATTLAAVYAAWVCLGLAMATTLYVPVFAVVTRRFPTDYRRRTITLTFLGGLASTVFIPLMAWLLNALGWRGPSAGHMRHPTSTAPHAPKPCASPRLCWWGCFRC